MSRPTGRIHELEHHAADRATTRPVVSGTQGVVSAGHPLVSMAGMRMLLSGGNAFDAVVAAGFAAAVVEAPALNYAERGFPMYEYMHRLLAIPESRSQFDIYPPGGTAVFYPDGRVPGVGDLFVQEALAGTLRRLVEADSRGRGHRAAGIAAARARFYRGDIAATIGAFSERWGGLLRASDLAGYRARLEPPLRTTFAGRGILGQSAWTQGPVLMQALGILASVDLRGLRHNSARYIHVVAEALKLAFADRERHYGDRERSEEHTSELQSRLHLVCRLLLEKKKITTRTYTGNLS